MNYDYPDVPWTGYHFNAQTRITHDTGVECQGFGIEPLAGRANVKVMMLTELTAPQKAILDNLMANDATLIPYGEAGDILYVKDLYEYREYLKQQTGQTFEIYYDKTGSLSDPNAKTDTIVLWYPVGMTQNQRKAVMDLYKTMISTTPGD